MPVEMTSVCTMTLMTTELFVLLLILISIKCSANVNILNAIADISSRPIGSTISNTKTFIEIAAEHGYRAEAHEVLTDDGYILTMHRIPAAQNCLKKYPVLMIHGLLQASECWLDAGSQAPGFLIADECYDTWFGNVRGTINSRRHVTLNPDTDLAFWKFSYDEIGIHDLPAMIDGVLSKTNAQKLIYIGFSQGGGTFIVMNSEKPEYGDKIGLFIGLSPSTRMVNTKSPVFRIFTETINKLHVQLETVGIWEILSKGFPIQGALTLLCKVELLATVICGLTTSLIDSPHPDSLTPEIEKKIYEDAPAGTSVQNVAHYGQSIYSEEFVKFDFGAEENKNVYGRKDPPEYNISAVKVPTLIYHGLADHIVDAKDTQWAASQMPNVLEYIQVEDPLWNHYDMVYSRFWKETIFVTMKKYLNKYDNDNKGN